VTALSLRYGLTIPGFRYDLLWEARRLVERLTGIPVQSHEAVIGMNAFAHESGIHVHGVLQEPATYESIPAEFVGGERRLVFGKHSGIAGVRYAIMKAKDLLEKDGIRVNEVLVSGVLKRVKELRNRRAEEGDAAQLIYDLEEKLLRLGLSEDDVIQIAKSLGTSAVGTTRLEIVTTELHAVNAKG
jgi:isopropylmalate/homocitrate/citramalate synthase